MQQNFRLQARTAGSTVSAVPEAASTADRALHLNLDGAWTSTALPLPTVDLLAWGPRLRFSAPPAEMERFRVTADQHLGSARFLVYGSGDFHHLSALWVRRAATTLTLVSFDNHPDWDVRPPRWCCGNWINRALDQPHVEHVAVWGCGNFECWGYPRIWGNHSDVRSGKLEVHPWADGRSAADQARPWSILQASWRERFTRFAATLNGRAVYVTVDLDGLRAGEAVTNWENGRFAASDVAWALGELRRHGATIVAGDLCGAYSPPTYARWKQKFASETDHPKIEVPEAKETARINQRAFGIIWPALTGKPLRSEW